MENPTRKPRIFAGTACTALLALFFAPRQSINNFPLVEAYLVIGRLILIGASLTAITFALKSWRRIDWITRILPFVAPAICLTIGTIVKFGTPVVDIQTTYIGAHDQILVDIAFGYGAVGKHQLKRNDVWTTNMGPPTEQLGVAWKRDYESPTTKQSFNISNEIPLVGADRIIQVTISDTEIRYNIILK